MAETKPFGISKRAVWEAYRRVRKNGGAAGVDRQLRILAQADH